MLRQLRDALARRVENALVDPAPRTILSEDCWGGEFCRAFGRPYTTPLAGAYIPSADYLDFLENRHRPDAFQLTPLEPVIDPPCPRGRTPYATIFFLHYATWEEAREKFVRRATRIAWDRALYKIDFGKPGYTQADVERWNALALEPAIALLPPESPLDLTRVHQGWRLRSWTLDGAAMFHIARRDFDFHHWLRTGRLHRSRLAALAHFLLFDPTTPTRVREFFRGNSALPRSRSR